MRFFTSLSAAWLAVCALGVDAQDGEFKKISVCLFMGTLTSFLLTSQQLRTHSLMPVRVAYFTLDHVTDEVVAVLGQRYAE